MENNYYRPLTIDEVYFEKPVFLQIPITEPGNHGLSVPEISAVHELPPPDLSKAIYNNPSLFQQTENFFLKNWPVLLISGLVISGYIYYRVKKKKEEKGNNYDSIYI